MMTMIIT